MTASKQRMQILNAFKEAFPNRYSELISKLNALLKESYNSTNRLSTTQSFTMAYDFKKITDQELGDAHEEGFSTFQEHCAKLLYVYLSQQGFLNVKVTYSKVFHINLEL